MYACTAHALHLQGGIANQNVHINISRSAVVSRAASSYSHLTGISEADLSKDEADVYYTASIGVLARAAHAATVAEPRSGGDQAVLDGELSALPTAVHDIRTMTAMLVNLTRLGKQSRHNQDRQIRQIPTGGTRTG
jgi:hypothetical protein